MADFQKNITNSVNVFGIGVTTRWGNSVFPYTMTWGTSRWGQGSNPIRLLFQKVIANTPAFTWDYASAGMTKNFSLGTATIESEPSVERLSQGIWDYVFVSDTTNAEERDFATWTEQSKPDVTFTCQAAGSTSWSEA